MGDARALIASLGASVSLVAGAALSLLVVSFVFAYDGLVGDLDDSSSQTALNLKALSPPTPATPGSARRSAAPVVMTRRAPSVAAGDVRRPAREQSERGSRVRTRRAQLAPAAADPNTITAPPVAPRPVRSTPGDSASDLGATVGGTVRDTGEAAGQVTAPVGPGVTQAVDDLLDRVGSLLPGGGG